MQKELEQVLTELQHVLIARRVLASNERIRLNWNHFLIMGLLLNRKQLKPSDISDALQLSRSSTSKYLKYLQDNKLVKAQQISTDKRSHIISPTALSNKIMNNIYKGQKQNAEQVQKSLSREEVKQFIAIANKITKSLDDESLREI